MSIRPFRDIKRKKTKVISVGSVKIGGDNPISVQSMTNTLTTDSKATIKQINEIHDEGADLVRVSCPDEASTSSLKEIVKHTSIPIIADIHFHHKRAIEAAENGASCLRINPGNIGDKKKIYDVLSAAKDNDCSIRIGVNAGSLEKDILDKFKEPCPEALVESALRNIKILEDQDFFNFKISVKSSDVFLSIEAYRQLSKITDYPLHLGITEAGSFISGSVKSSIGIGSLLLSGIGDTIRISLSDNPIKEVKIGNEILKSLNLRERGVKIISCPSCARQGFQVIETVKILEDQNFFNFKISVKSSDVFLSIEAYKQLSKVTEYPLHLGITEAGSFVSGSVKSSIGVGTLLLDGIGDTIRISLSDDPVKEVKIGNEILKSLNLREKGVKIISCPSCARQGFKVIETVKILEEKLSHIKTPITLSIIGCVVNGPGEAAMTDVGVTGGKNGSNMLYLSGIQKEKILTDDMISRVIDEVEKKASELKRN